MRHLLIVAGLFLVVPTAALAQTEKGNIEWGLFAGREFFSNSSGADDDFVVGLRAGYGIWKNFEIEIIYDAIDTNIEPQAEIVVEIDSLTANFMWNLWTSKREIAGMYVSGGVGTIDVSLEIPPQTVSAGILPTDGWVGNIPNPTAGTYDDDDTLVTLAAGVRAFIGKRTALRYELRAKDYKVFEISTTDLEVTVGFSIFHRRKN
jgi:hypothetical protein